MIGIDSQTGQPQLTFGADALLDGIDIVIVVIARFILCWLGFLGLLMREGGIPVAPAVVGLLLGAHRGGTTEPRAALSEGDLSIRRSSPITVALWAAVAVGLVTSVVVPAVRRSRTKTH